MCPTWEHHSRQVSSKLDKNWRFFTNSTICAEPSFYTGLPLGKLSHNFKTYFSHQIAICAANAFSFYRDCPITSLAVHPQYFSKIHDNYIRSDSGTEKSFRRFSWKNLLSWLMGLEVSKYMLPSRRQSLVYRFYQSQF